MLARIIPIRTERTDRRRREGLRSAREWMAHSSTTAFSDHLKELEQMHLPLRMAATISSKSFAHDFETYVVKPVGTRAFREMPPAFPFSCLGMLMLWEVKCQRYSKTRVSQLQCVDPGCSPPHCMPSVPRRIMRKACISLFTGRCVSASRELGPSSVKATGPVPWRFKRASMLCQRAETLN
jgi:hypothetical protein